MENKGIDWLMIGIVVGCTISTLSNDWIWLASSIWVGMICNLTQTEYRKFKRGNNEK